MSLSKRTRFEVLKRDGFRCRYCGITAVAVALHVDHVVAVASGGTDDPINLVTACASCNLGKSDVGLDESRISPGDPMELAMEHVEQMRMYLDAQRAVDAERARLSDFLDDRWREVIGNDPPAVLRWRPVLDRHSLQEVDDAIEAVAVASWRLKGASAHARYFFGVLRRRREA